MSDMSEPGEQGQSRVLTVYQCPKCGSESLERYPCVFSQHTGYNHGATEREPVGYVAVTPGGVKTTRRDSVVHERDHWIERAKQEYARADDLEALLVRVMRHPEVRAVVGPELIRLTNDATGAGWPWEYPSEPGHDGHAYVRVLDPGGPPRFEESVNPKDLYDPDATEDEREAFMLALGECGHVGDEVVTDKSQKPPRPR